MGYCKLPSKRDYWKVGGIYPTHWMSKMFPRNRFEYIFRNISVDPSFALSTCKKKKSKPTEAEVVDFDVDDCNGDDNDDDAVENFLYKQLVAEEEEEIVEEEELPTYTEKDNKNPELLRQADYNGETFHKIEYRKSLKRTPKQKKDKWYKKAEFFHNWLNNFS